YGSLVPFHYQSLSSKEAAARFDLALHDAGPPTREDAAANITLFLPLGYLFLGCLALDRARWMGLAAAPLVVAGGLTLSTAVEFAQLYFPPRIAAGSDIFCQSIGCVSGVLGWLLVGQRITQWMWAVHAAESEPELASLVLPGYIALLAVLQLLPANFFPPSLPNPATGAGLAWPWCTARAGWDALAVHCVQIAYFVPIGLLLSLLPGSRGFTPRAGLYVAVIGLGAASLSQFLYWITPRRQFDRGAAIFQALVVFITWCGTLAWQHRLQWRCSQRLAKASAPSTSCSGRRAAACLALGYLAALMLVKWYPFDFYTDLARVGQRMARITWLPLADFYWQDYTQVLQQSAENGLLFFLFGLMSALALRPACQRRSPLVVTMLGLACAALLEAGRLFLPSHKFALSAVWVGSGATWLGAVCGRHWLTHRRADRS
ncbi:MAG TPA: VanZ family protein, partial [Gemmataceae bacterium]|nr:VanZ family protein [Gemmataceae bacterium]